MLLLGIALPATACREREGSAADPGAPAPTASVSPGAAPGNPTTPSPEWVKVYDPGAAWNGYTLTLHEARTPVLLDMNGREVHRWPQARLRSRVRLLPDGSILGIDLGRVIVEHDWEGRQTLALRTPGAIPHHDVIRLRNGNTLALVLRDKAAHDTLLELDRAGTVVWTWEAKERLGPLLPRKPARPRDVTHVNSVQELPENPWHAAGDERFRPGNLLLSARNLDTVFVVDRRSGDVVWSFRDGLDMQHEALMTAPGLPGAGLVQLFNNRRASFGDDRQSEVLELDPTAGEVAWRFRAPGFFSPTGGTQQALPNGNVLITSTRGGRVFEVTRAGRVVWEWVPPRYEPIRALRVAADACPQLAALPAQQSRAVTPPPGYRHVDPDAYRFARRGSRRTVTVAGTKRVVLERQDDCRPLLLPMDPRLLLAWGVDRSRPAARGAAPVFVATLHPAGAEPVELLRDAVGAEGAAWRERTLSLAPFAGQAVRLCVAVEAAAGDGAAGARRDGGDRPVPFAFWEQPLVTAGDEAPRAGEDDDGPAALPDDLTPEERDVQRRHLEALGYVG